MLRPRNNNVQVNAENMTYRFLSAVWLATLIGILFASLSACSDSPPKNKGDFELNASALSQEVQLNWNVSEATNFNLYVSSDKDCDFSDYGSCSDGVMVANATSPY